jgi:serine/threonine protein kinase/predicted ATPase
MTTPVPAYEADVDATPERFGRYELVRPLAKGGMAEIWLGRMHGAHGFARSLAIKRMAPSLAKNDHAVARFLDEARVQARLQHPSIVQIFDLGEAEGRLFIAMEHVEGTDLSAATKQQRPVPPALAAFVVAKAAEGLHFAHEHTDERTGRPLKLVHRDITPHNILLSRFGDVKVADFGIARFVEQQARGQKGVVLGKVPYMSPEQVRDHALDRRSDVFALGTVLYELLVGKRPFNGLDELMVMMAIADVVPDAPAKLEPSVPEELSDLVMRALEKRPGDRFPSAGELSSALHAWLRHSGEPMGSMELGRWVRELATFHPPPSDRTEGVAQGLVAATPTATTAPVELARSSEDDTRPPAPRLPEVETSFFGRAAELDAVGESFGRSRVVTVTGPGGMGKTRLALRFADGDRDDGRPAWFCDLSSAESTDALCRALADAIGVPLEGDDDALTQLGHALRARSPALFVLDNFEQLGDGGATTLARLAALAGDAWFLVTSRERLHLDGEAVVDLGPLSLPTQSEGTSEAEALFRSRAEDAGHALDEDDRPLARDLVRALDGIPLALELAAAQLGDRSVAELRARLSERLDLRRESSSASGRQATLRAALEWSWQLLDDEQQRALARCAVFAGGFDLAAATAVVGDEAEALVGALVDKSLLSRSLGPVGSWRFSMYATVRVFAGEKLRELGGLDDVQRAHAAHYLDRCETLTRRLRGADAAEASLELRLERENLLAVHRVATRDSAPSRETAERALRAARALAPIFSSDGPRGQWLWLLESSIALAEKEPALRGALGRALDARGMALYESQRFDEALQDLERAGELLAGEPRALARVRRHVGLVLIDAGSLDDAERSLFAALDLFRAARHRPGEGMTLSSLGLVHGARGDLEESISFHERALLLLEETGSPRAVGTQRGLLGAALLEAGRADEAYVHFMTALSYAWLGGLGHYEALYRTGVGQVQLERGQFSEARRELVRATRVSRRLGDRRVEGLTLALLAANDACLGDVARAEQGFARARTAVRESGAAGDRELLEILQGVLAATAARSARGRGDVDAADRHEEELRSALRRAQDALAQARSGAVHYDTSLRTLLASAARVLDARATELS